MVQRKTVINARAARWFPKNQRDTLSMSRGAHLRAVMVHQTRGGPTLRVFSVRLQDIDFLISALRLTRFLPIAGWPFGARGVGWR